ncbi:MAG: aminoglycoside 6'-N-acetyltransferase [Planctomycetaceae bacterium]
MAPAPAPGTAEEAEAGEAPDLREDRHGVAGVRAGLARGKTRGAGRPGRREDYVQIRAVRSDERPRWLELRSRLWPDHSPEELAREQEWLLAQSEKNGVLVAAGPDGRLVGFVEVSLRDWAQGCGTHPVGYLEGWYVAPEHRRLGLGRRLLEAAERWARSKGCTEMGSDADPDNVVSHAAHGALGFAEVGRQVLFRKSLAP